MVYVYSRRTKQLLNTTLERYMSRSFVPKLYMGQDRYFQNASIWLGYLLMLFIENRSIILSLNNYEFWPFLKPRFFTEKIKTVEKSYLTWPFSRFKWAFEPALWEESIAGIKSQKEIKTHHEKFKKLWDNNFGTPCTYWRKIARGSRIWPYFFKFCTQKWSKTVIYREIRVYVDTLENAKIHHKAMFLTTFASKKCRK